MKQLEFTTEAQVRDYEKSVWFDRAVRLERAERELRQLRTDTELAARKAVTDAWRALRSHRAQQDAQALSRRKLEEIAALEAAREANEQ